MDPQILGLTVQKLIARGTWRPGFVHPCLKDSFEFGDITYSNSYKNEGSMFLQNVSKHWQNHTVSQRRRLMFVKPSITQSWTSVI